MPVSFVTPSTSVPISSPKSSRTSSSDALVSSTVSCSRAAHRVAVSSRMPAQILATPIGWTMKSSPLARRWSAWRSQANTKAFCTSRLSIGSVARSACSSMTANRSPRSVRWPSVRRAFGPAGARRRAWSTGWCSNPRSFLGAPVRAPSPERVRRAGFGFGLALVAVRVEARAVFVPPFAFGAFAMSPSLGGRGGDGAPVAPEQGLQALPIGAIGGRALELGARAVSQRAGRAARGTARVLDQLELPEDPQQAAADLGGAREAPGAGEGLAERLASRRLGLAQRPVGVGEGRPQLELGAPDGVGEVELGGSPDEVEDRGAEADRRGRRVEGDHVAEASREGGAGRERRPRGDGEAAGLGEAAEQALERLAAPSDVGDRDQHGLAAREEVAGHAGDALAAPVDGPAPGSHGLPYPGRPPGAR